MITSIDLILIGFFIAVAAAIIWIFPILPATSTKERLDFAKGILYIAIFIALLGALSLTDIGELVENFFYAYIFR